MVDIESLNHIAIIPDGNRRWAKLHGVTALEGHRRGTEAMRAAVKYLLGHQIKHLTLWGFSQDNWRRSQEEVLSIFQLLAIWIEKETPWAHSQGVRLCHLGRLDQLPEYLRTAVMEAAAITKDNSRMVLNVAFNYTGRAEIVEAIQRLINENVPAASIDESMVSRYLYTNNTPDVDLIIRTAGEFRLSNFLIWQTAYSEYYFTPVLWPDFNEKELGKALAAYGQRKRRFGGD